MKYVVLGCLFVFLLFPAIMFLPSFLLWVSWTWYGIGVTYFNFLPQQFHVVSFWDCFFLLMTLGTVGSTVTGAYGRAFQSGYNSKKS